MDSLMREVFEHIDVKKTGELDAQEIVRVIAELAGKDGDDVAPGDLQQAQELIAEFDASQTGTLSYKEFATMMAELDHKS